MEKSSPGVNIAALLSESPRITTYLLGGNLRHQSLGTSGAFAEQMLRSFNADIALIAAEGFTTRDGLTYSYEADASLARLMHEYSSRTVVLATARKLLERDRITALKTGEVDVLITGSRDGSLLGGFKECGLEIVAVPAEGFMAPAMQAQVIAGK